MGHAGSGQLYEKISRVRVWQGGSMPLPEEAFKVQTERMLACAIDHLLLSFLSVTPSVSSTVCSSSLLIYQQVGSHYRSGECRFLFFCFFFFKLDPRITTASQELFEDHCSQVTF